jgi:hypothetical protein
LPKALVAERALNVVLVDTFHGAGARPLWSASTMKSRLRAKIASRS